MALDISYKRRLVLGRGAEGSLPRNTLLAEIFYYAGFIESWGHGTIKIVDNCIEQGLPEPDFSEENGVMTVTFYKDK